MCMLLVAACGSDKTTAEPTPPPPPSLAEEVQATEQITFSPNRVTIVRGGTVTFDFGSLAHNVYFDGAPVGAPANITGQNSNVSKTLTFDSVGTFVYDCHIHPGMKGTVIVVDPAAKTVR
jgi:plastocyanin